MSVSFSLFMVLGVMRSEGSAQICSRDAESFLGESRSPIEEVVRSHHGVVGLAIVDPRSDRCLLINERERFPAGALSAVPIMIETFSRVSEGVLSTDAPLSVLEIDKVPGSGVLHHLSAPRTVTVWDAVYLMATLSDQTATNLILDKLRPMWVTTRMRDLGLPDTRVFGPAGGDPRDSFDPQGADEFGHAVTTPFEMATLFTWMQRKTLMGASGSETLAGILEQELAQAGIPRHLPAGVRVAHKAASMPGGRHDCGLVFGPVTEFVVCVLTRGNTDNRAGVDNEAVSMIAQIAALAYDELNPTVAGSEGRGGGVPPLQWLALAALVALAGGGAIFLRLRRSG